MAFVDRALPDGRSDIAQPGMSDERQKSKPCGRHCIFPTSQGSRRDVTMPVITRGLEHQDLICVYSGCVDRLRSAWKGEACLADLLACQLCARSKRRSGRPSHSQGGESLAVRDRSEEGILIS